jgi:hypothetical protein
MERWLGVKESQEWKKKSITVMTAYLAQNGNKPIAVILWDFCVKDHRLQQAQYYLRRTYEDLRFVSDTIYGNMLNKSQLPCPMAAPRWDHEQTRTFYDTNRNKKVHCTLCGEQAGEVGFNKKHTPELCQRLARDIVVPPVIPAEPAEPATAEHDTDEKSPDDAPAYAQVSLPEGRVRELMSTLLGEGNVSAMQFETMFGKRRRQAMAGFFNYKNENKELMQELLGELKDLVLVLLKEKFGATLSELMHATVLVSEGAGGVEDATDANQDKHKDCTGLMYAHFGPVHSVFVNAQGIRLIGTANEDIELLPYTLTVVHGRHSHFGKGRTLQQGSHRVLHMFCVLYADSSLSGDMTDKQIEHVCKALPEIGEDKPETRVWPGDEEYMICAKCSKRRPIFACSGCGLSMCWLCSDTECHKCPGCTAKRKVAPKRKRK